MYSMLRERAHNTIHIHTQEDRQTDMQATDPVGGDATQTHTTTYKNAQAPLRSQANHAHTPFPPVRFSMMRVPGWRGGRRRRHRSFASWSGSGSTPTPPAPRPVGNVCVGGGVGVVGSTEPISWPTDRSTRPPTRPIQPHSQRQQPHPSVADPSYFFQILLTSPGMASVALGSR
jgi:hypothetical protein